MLLQQNVNTTQHNTTRIYGEEAHYRDRGRFPFIHLPNNNMHFLYSAVVRYYVITSVDTGKHDNMLRVLQKRFLTMVEL